MTDALARLAYRAAFLMARAWWFVRRPETFGAVVALWCDGRLLLVRTSYRGLYTLPGGFVKSRERAIDAALRELSEELHLSLPPEMLKLGWHGSTAFECRLDTTTVWEVALQAPPPFDVDGREIVWAGWKTRDEARALALSPPLRAYLVNRSTPRHGSRGFVANLDERAGAAGRDDIPHCRAKTRVTDVLIVGGGPAGLATAASLRARSISYRLLERGPTVGHAWRHLYDSLTLHTGRHMSFLPGLRFPPGTPLFPTRDQFWDYLSQYARHHDLLVENGRTVSRLTRVEGRWLADADGEVIAARWLVMATGVMSNPRVADVPGRARFHGKVIHSIEYRRPASLEGQRVLVVGVGNSGGEIASELGRAGRRVTVAVRSGANVVPRQIAGIPIQYIAVWLGKLPAGAQARLAGAVLDLSERRRGAPVLPRATTSPLESIPLIGFHLVDAIRAGLVQTKLAGVEAFTENGVRFTDGTEAAFDAVIFATGFTAALGPLNGLVRLDARGFALRTDRVTSADQPELCFVGQNYDATGALANIRTDSVLAAERIAASPR